MKEGNSLGARVELARTYETIGERLKGAESRFDALDGIGADGYLRRAQRLFEEMGLDGSL